VSTISKIASDKDQGRAAHRSQNNMSCGIILGGLRVDPPERAVKMTRITNERTALGTLEHSFESTEVSSAL
jgi:hypothetical protein